MHTLQQSTDQVQEEAIKLITSGELPAAYVISLHEFLQEAGTATLMDYLLGILSYCNRPAVEDGTYMYFPDMYEQLISLLILLHRIE